MGNENPLVLYYFARSNFQADSEVEPKPDHVTGQWSLDDGSEKETESVIDVQGNVIYLTKNVTQFQVLNSIALNGGGLTGPYQCGAFECDPSYVDTTIYRVAGFVYETRTYNGKKQRRVVAIKTDGGQIPFENNDVRSIRVLIVR